MARSTGLETFGVHCKQTLQNCVNCACTSALLKLWGRGHGQRSPVLERARGCAEVNGAAQLRENSEAGDHQRNDEEPVGLQRLHIQANSQSQRGGTKGGDYRHRHRSAVS